MTKTAAFAAVFRCFVFILTYLTEREAVWLHAFQRGGLGQNLREIQTPVGIGARTLVRVKYPCAFLGGDLKDDVAVQMIDINGNLKRNLEESMKKFALFAFVGALLCMATLAMADDKNAQEPVRFVVCLVDGSQLRGTLSASTLSMKTDVGNVVVPVEKIGQLEFQKDHELVSILLLSGDKLTGTLDVNEFRLTTVFGKFPVKTALVTTIKNLSSLPAMRNLAGAWRMGGPYNVGRPCQIIQENEALTFVNEHGNQSSGNFQSDTQVIATDWENGLIGTLTDDHNRINWKNGTWWIRSEK